jgi:hypothetical protein
MTTVALFVAESKGIEVRTISGFNANFFSLTYSIPMTPAKNLRIPWSVTFP